MSRKSRDEVENPTKSPTRPYSLQGRDISVWYTPKVGSGQNSRSRPDPTNSLVWLAPESCESSIWEFSCMRIYPWLSYLFEASFFENRTESFSQQVSKHIALYQIAWVEWLDHSNRHMIDHQLNFSTDFPFLHLNGKFSTTDRVHLRVRLSLNWNSLCKDQVIRLYWRPFLVRSACY